MFGDESKFRHSQSEEGWNLQAVTQSFSPATWNKIFICLGQTHSCPQENKIGHRQSEGFVRLEESVAALWKLWAHAKGQSHDVWRNAE